MMTQRINIQEQTFEVYEDMIPKLIIDSSLDPIEYNLYLNNFRLVGLKKPILLEKKVCIPVGLCSGRIVNIDQDYLKYLHVSRIQDIDDVIFSDFMLEFRMMIQSPQIQELVQTSVGKYLIDVSALPSYFSLVNETNISNYSLKPGTIDNKIIPIIPIPSELHYEYYPLGLLRRPIKREDQGYNIRLSSKSHDKSIGFTDNFCMLEKLSLVLHVDPNRETLCSILSNIESIEYSLGLSKNLVYDGYYLILINAMENIYFDEPSTFLITLPSLNINLSHLPSPMEISIRLKDQMEIEGYVICKEKLYRGRYKTFPSYCYDINTSPETKIIPVTDSHTQHRVDISEFNSTTITTGIIIMAIKDGKYDKSFDPRMKCTIKTNTHEFLSMDKYSCNLLCRTMNKKTDPCILYWCFNYEDSKICSYVNFRRYDSFEIIIDHEPFNGEFRIYTESKDCIKETNSRIGKIGWNAFRELS